jgi:hypothetical protein
MKKTALICFIINIFHQVAAQNIVTGTWEAQTYSNSCWAASIANLKNPVWECERLEQDELFKNSGSVGLPTVTHILDQYFKHRGPLIDSILTFNAINYYLRYPFNRPLILGYNYEDKAGGHFVNIVGCSLSKTELMEHKYWLQIFDPKPDNIGSKYLKNYESYKRAKGKKTGLNGTFYTIVNKKFDLPKVYYDSLNNEIDRILVDSSNLCNDCLNDDEKLQSNLLNILKDSIFNITLGDKIKFKEQWRIPIIKITNPEELLNGLETSKNVSNASLIITYDKNNKLKGGIILNQISNKLLIERVEDISKYKYIQGVFEKANANLIITKNEFKFIRYTVGKTQFFVDIDTLFDKKIPKIYNIEQFKEKIRPHNFEITESGRLIIEACQKLVKGQGCEIIENSGSYYEQCIITDLPIKEWRDSSSLIDVKRYPIRIHYKKYLGIEDKLVNRFQMGWNYEWFDSTLINRVVNKCKDCYPKIENYKIVNEKPIGEQLGGNFIYFVPIEKFKKYKNTSGKRYDSDIEKIYYNLALHPSEMKDIINPRIEIQKGFLATNFKKNYLDTSYPVGLICDIILKNNTLVNCYVFNQLLPSLEIDGVTNPDIYLWKK